MWETAGVACYFGKGRRPYYVTVLCRGPPTCAHCLADLVNTQDSRALCAILGHASDSAAKPPGDRRHRSQQLYATLTESPWHVWVRTGTVTVSSAAGFSLSWTSHSAGCRVDPGCLARGSLSSTRGDSPWCEDQQPSRTEVATCLERPAAGLFSF